MTASHICCSYMHFGLFVPVGDRKTIAERYCLCHTSNMSSSVLTG